MKKTILKSIVGLVVFALVVYIVTSIVLNCWNPKNWVAAANTIYAAEQPNPPSENEEPGIFEPGSDQPAAPSSPLTPEALKYIDAVNDALDSKDIKQYQLLSIISCNQNLRESDLTRKEVVAAREAGSLIVKNAVLESGITYSLPLDARLAAAQIMIAAGLRTEISWVH